MTEGRPIGGDRNEGAAGADPNIDNIPLDLRERRRWVAWSREQRKPDAKPTKVPVNPHTGKRASTTDARTWGSFDEATARMQADHLDGVGFVFVKEDGLVGVDLDGCRNPSTGALEPWARKIISKLASYTEISPSGEGVHVILRGSLPPEGRRKGPIEMYEDGRYFTMTGARLEGAPAEIVERTTELAEIHAGVFGGAQSPAPEADARRDRDALPIPDLDDGQLIERASAAKNGAKFDALWRGDASAYTSGSEADLGLCGILAYWTRGDAARIDRLFRRSKLMRDKWDQLRGKRTYGQRTIAKALAGRSTFYTPTRRTDGEDGAAPDKRPQVRLIPSCMPVAIDLAERALRLDGGTAVYQRGSMLVRVVRLARREAQGKVARWRGTPVIVPLDVAYLCDRLDQAVCFIDVGEEGTLPVDCPPDLARRFLSRVGQWRLPPLAGIQQCPMILGDGRIVRAAGYDKDSGLLLDFGGETFPAIPDRPDASSVKRAMDLLLELLGEFPFVSPVDRSVVLAAIFTAIARHAFTTAPGFGNSAPEMGTGKSLLAHIAAYIATDRRAAAMSQGPDENEDRKRIFALLLSGVQTALVDNIMRPVSGAALASVLTEETLQDRVLGKSEVGTVPTTSTTWTFTGNNLVIAGDLRTRILVAQLDAKEARPWQRKFKTDIYRFIRERRGELVGAVLTILRAHAAAGWPDMGLAPFGRFEDWSRVVRGAVVWADQPDPVEVLARLEEADPETQELARLHHAWRIAVGAEVTTAAEWITRAEHRAEARGLLTELAAGRTGDPDAVRLGKLLGKHERRVREGWRFERAGMHGGTVHWRLSRLGGDGGDGGDVSSHDACGDADHAHDVTTHVDAGVVVAGTHPTTPTNPTQHDDRVDQRRPRPAARKPSGEGPVGCECTGGVRDG